MKSATVHDKDNFDFLIRGEGEVIFQHLAETAASGTRDYRGVQGLSYRNDGQFQHNPPAELLDLNLIKLPNRDSRVLDRAEFLGQSFDWWRPRAGVLWAAIFAVLDKCTAAMSACLPWNVSFPI